jgi:hypothetical protein
MTRWSRRNTLQEGLSFEKCNALFRLNALDYVGIDSIELETRTECRVQVDTWLLRRRHCIIG